MTDKPKPTIMNFSIDMTRKHVRNTLSWWIPGKRNKVQFATKSQTRKSAVTFQECLRATLVIGQVFSLIPVSGILSNNVSDVRFVVISWRTIYTFVVLIGQSFMAVMCLYQLIESNISLTSAATIVFYFTNLVTNTIFLKMAKRWPNLVQYIYKTEQSDPNYDRNLNKKCGITCAVVLSLALVEHFLSLISAISASIVCFENTPRYEAFVRHFYPWVFNFLPFSPILGAITQFLHVQATFVWNYSDVFVINMSYYLQSRLQEVNKKLMAAKGKYLPEAFWKSKREDYCRITQLVRRADDVINGIIFICFANNLFFVCLQLYNTLEDGIKGNGQCNSRQASETSHILGGYEAAAFFIFSLVYLISRSAAVSLIASQVNIASTVPAAILYDVPSPVYCVEVQRFIDQVNGDIVALSGLQFFNITRGLLLKVAGTIVTYELVMFQFNSSDDKSTSANSTITTPATKT